MSQDKSTAVAQPPIRPGAVGKGSRSRPLYQAGSKRSRAVLRDLGFDPITALVEQYRELEEELRYHEALRAGTIVQLSEKGNPLRYRWEPHMKCYELLQAIGDKLLRYGYGRVPEGDDLSNRRPAPMIIEMSSTGEVWSVEPSGVAGEEGED